MFVVRRLQLQWFTEPWLVYMCSQQQRPCRFGPELGRSRREFGRVASSALGAPCSPLMSLDLVTLSLCLKWRSDFEIIITTHNGQWLLLNNVWMLRSVCGKCKTWEWESLTRANTMYPRVIEVQQTMKTTQVRWYLWRCEWRFLKRLWSLSILFFVSFSLFNLFEMHSYSCRLSCYQITW